jgi:hypothetical protein
LQDEGEEVAADEGNGIEGRAEAREFSPVNDDNVSQADIDGGAEEGRGDGEPDQITARMVSSTVLDAGNLPTVETSHLEPGARKRVVV